MSVPLVHPRYKRDFVYSNGIHFRDSVAEPLTRNDLVLPSGGNPINNYYLGLNNMQLTSLDYNL